MTPFEQGYAAFLSGKPIGANPFDVEVCPYSRGRWESGWYSAQFRRKEKQT